MKLAIVGGFGGTHIGGSLARAATHLGVETVCFDLAKAMRGNRYLRALCWRFIDRRPPHLQRFSAEIVEVCGRARPDVLIATGMAALTGPAVRALRGMGIVCINYSTDDPWNPAHRSRWHLRALPEYDFVFTPRRANVGDFHRLGCSEVHYLPFGYDEGLFGPSGHPFGGAAPEVLFVGGADKDRAAFMAEYIEAGPPPSLVGGYWERFSVTRPYALGRMPPDALYALTAAAKINLCLVRRANRDGHVMRSFEIAAVGGCMLAEDTEEHREILGADGECVIYFRTPREAADRARVLIGDPAERARLSWALRARVAGGANTYRDRLATMMAAASARENRAVPAA